MTEQAVAAVVDATTAVKAADAATGVAAAEAVVDTQGELKKLIAQRDELKRKLREIEPLAAKAKELEQAQMTEQQKLAARVAELEPKATKVERYEAVIGSLLESELATVPEEMRDIVPATLSPEDRLDWLRQAKSKGLFRAAQETQPKPVGVNPPSNPSPQKISGADFDPQMAVMERMRRNAIARGLPVTS